MNGTMGITALVGGLNGKRGGRVEQMRGRKREITNIKGIWKKPYRNLIIKTSYIFL